MRGNKQLKINLKIVIILITILLIAVVAICTLIINNKDKVGSKDVSKFVRDEAEQQQTMNTDFSMIFLKLENNKENIIYSPLSIKYALKMLNEGANGNTKTQIENVIGELNITKYYNVDKVLSLANAIYIRDNYAKNIKDDYKKILTEKYNAEINYDSFYNANNINNWIENKTLGIIKNMVRDEDVQNPDNKMLLINSLAIDMEWEDSFDSKNTRGADFYLEDGSSLNATTMHLKTSSDNVSYYKNKNIIALAMDLKKYTNIQLEFVAIMPEEKLSDYVENFSIKEFDNIIENLNLASKTKNGVDISIPRFSIDYDLKLKKDLINLGITDSFDNALADFSNISDTGFYVNDAKHKANINFTEKGIKSSSVSIIYMSEGMIPVEDELIKVNIVKPFIYVIRDKNTGEIWFVGTVYEPNFWEDDKVNYQYK